MTRGERRARTARKVRARLRVAKSDYWRKVPGKLKKRSPVCHCWICRLAKLSAKISRDENMTV